MNKHAEYTMNYDEYTMNVDKTYAKEIPTLKIFDSKLLFPYAKEIIDVVDPKFYISYWTNQHYTEHYYYGYHYIKHKASIYSAIHIKKFSKYMYKTFGNLFVKMLACMEKSPCSYHEIYAQCLKPRGKPFGNDSLSFFSMEERGLMKLDHLGKYKRRFFSLTQFGQKVLDIAKKNTVAYKVLRHVTKLDGDDEYVACNMIDIQLNPDTMDDLTPKAYVDMLDAILDSNSPLHEVGSYSYFCNKLLTSLKKSKTWFDTFNCPEVKSYLESHMTNPNVARFSKVFSKIGKKHNKSNV